MEAPEGPARQKGMPTGYVPPTPEERERIDRLSWRRAWILFAVTVFTVFSAGYLLAPPDTPTLHPLLRGWVFAVPLFTILIFHEMGHYVMAQVHGVHTSPPYFIPFPSIIGTLGAVITIRSPIYNRRALMDIGAAGPIAGFIPSVVFLYVGYLLSEVTVLPASGDVIVFGDSLISWAVQHVTVGPLPEGHDIFIHPVGFAGWVGILLTFLNLLPAGQLDGGHVSYAMWGRAQWLAGPVLVFGMVVLGFTLSGWWLQILAFYLILLHIMALVARVVYGVRFPLSAIWKGAILKHPPVPNDEPLDARRRLVGWICVMIFLLCVMPVPIRFGI